jgi:diguanylate cyclase (GGDEF)-like protein
MAASDINPRFDRPPAGDADCLAPAALRERLEEEISRAERHGTRLSCLLVKIDNLEQIAQEHGEELLEQTIAYVAGALRRELRRYDRIGRVDDAGHAGQISDRDLLIILPGADSARGEIVARRALERLRTIKVEAGGTRRPLEICVGLTAWRQDVGAEALLAHARAALRSVNGEHRPPAHATAHDGAALPPLPEQPAAAGTRARTGDSPALGRAGGA